jgi:CheY-like chemotaxis protein
MAHPAEGRSGPDSGSPGGSGTPGTPGTPRTPGGPRRPGSGEPRFTGQKVLIVDGDTRGAYALGSALSARGLTVVRAANGPDGLAAVEHDPAIRAVLMDIALPGLDGYATAARMRALGRGAETPIIAVTFETSAADRTRALAAGMDAHLAKPVDVTQLLRVLAELMN